MPPQKNFSQYPQANRPRSVFNRSHTHKSGFDANYLVPFVVDEILPGDSVDLRANLFARLSAPLDYPIMDNLHLDTFHFFVPSRILWENWEYFMGAHDDKWAQDTEYTVPQMVEATSQAIGSLSDYFGLVPGKPFSVNALPFRAYRKIWNEFFRDENLQDMIDEETGDGPEDPDNYALLKRNKRHDYFTSCLPEPQKGDAVNLFINDAQAPVIGDGKSLGYIGDNPSGTEREFGIWASGGQAVLDTAASGANVGDAVTPSLAPTNGYALGISEDPDKSHIFADLSGAVATTINDLRLAIATQQMLELDARAGTRYFSLLKSHFGIVSPDSRLQRPEYLGGSTNMMLINPVTQTGASDSANDLYQGNQAGHVTGASRSGFSKSFVEHGYLISLVNVRADLTYQQGVNRMWKREDRFDFYFPTFAHLGEQAVLQGEIFSDGTSNDDIVFGYNEAWSEYRFKNSLITGQFRSDATQSLEAWHLSQDFAAAPTLNEAFIQENVPLDRVLAFTQLSSNDIPQIIFDSFIEMKHARVMPVYSVPGLRRL